ncbi:MAG: asparagine synthase (glutamine-hydrolyzing) [Acidimicrobiales bacterium]
MCGIAGVFDPACSTPADELAHTATAMATTIEHRGPDDGDIWIDAAAGIAFGHRRLAVVGLGAVGHQPMASPGGRYVANYNGEIYNFGAVARRLDADGVALRGGSDTEVLLAAVEHWGLDNALDAVEGMFALALWDREQRRLHLIRDRLGEKPLYYGWVGGRLAFASELKALRCLPAFVAELDRAAAALFLRHNCVPAPRTIYRDVAKLEAGHILTVGPGDRPGPALRPRAYWSAADAVGAALEHPLSEPDQALADRVETVLGDAVAARMEADVPVGAFLSGGIDSSLVVALMQRVSARPVRTFTIGFAESAFDESADAAAVAAHLGTDHTALRVGDAEARDVIPSLPDIWDEPFGDCSQIPTLLVSRLARTQVTVSLSGDGGDELFAGYNRHAWLERLQNRASGLPPGLRRWVGASMGRVPPSAVDAAARVTAVLPSRWRVRNPSDKFVKVGRVLAADGAEAAYLALVSHWDDPEALVRGSDGEVPGNGSEAGRTVASSPETWPDLGGITAQVLWLDLVGYLPDDILTKLDRAAMACSLETRVPFLDRQVLDLAWRLPMTAKLQGSETKKVLRRVLHRHVPAALVDRPKMGFGVPVGAWLRGPLRPWAEELLGRTRLEAQGVLDPAPVRAAWEAHQSGRRDFGYALWDVLMLEAWLERWMTVATPARPR